MSIGPVLIFDKSALQSFSVDESCWLENFFLTNHTPLFFVETLADLEKEMKGSRTPEQVVGELAVKSPGSGYPNVHHRTLFVYDLMGKKVEMSFRPIVSGGQTKVTPDGKIGVHFKQFPEMDAFQRWQDGKFLEVEQGIAKEWRLALSNLSFDSYIALVKNVPGNKKFKTLKEVKEFVDEFVKVSNKAHIHLVFELLGIPTHLQTKILTRWKKEMCPSLEKFAPYASHVFKVDLFFFLALSSDLIPKERASNKIDIAYLYYLPFCNIFVSGDKLHAKTVPLFLNEEQVFINGKDLKEALKQLDEYYSKYPEDVKAQGIMRFAVYPPEDIDTLVARLWDKYLPIWRTHAKEKREKPRTTPSDGSLLKHLNDVAKNSVPIQSFEEVTADEADHVIFERRISLKKGKWRMMPPGVE